MAKKYAQRSQVRRKTPPKKKAPRGPGKGIWSVLILTAGLILAFGVGLYYLKKANPQTLHPSVVPPKIRPVESRPKPKKVRPEATEAHFDFYDLLPKNEIETKPVSKPSRNIKNHPVSSERNLLQIASFKKYEDADQLKAALVLNGFNVEIKRFEAAGVAWHRVYVIPGPTLKSAKEVQQALKKQNIDSILVSIKY